MDDTEKDQEQTQKPLGDLLISYREKAGMDIDQAADTLCLTVGTLTALENEAFHQLPEAPYIRGYLRSYAKLADTSSTEAIALYESLRGGEGNSELAYNFAPNTPVEKLVNPVISPTVLRLGILTITVLILAILSMIPSVRDWAGNVWSEFSPKSNENNVQITHSSTPEITEHTPELQKPAETPSEPATSNQANSGIDNTETKLTEHDTPEDETNSTQETASLDGIISRTNPIPSPTAAVTPTNGEKTNGEMDIVENSEQATTEQKTATTDETAPPALDEFASSNIEQNSFEIADTTEKKQEITPPEEETEASRTSENPQDIVIKLVFKEEVWMRVQNDSGKDLFNALKSSGNTEEFNASKPLSFKVGNAPGVDIFIDGKLYDQTPHQRGVVSKFEIN